MPQLLRVLMWGSQGQDDLQLHCPMPLSLPQWVTGWSPAMRLDAGCIPCTAHSLQGQRRALYYDVPLRVGELHTEATLPICSSLGFSDPFAGSSVLEKPVSEAWASLWPPPPGVAEPGPSPGDQVDKMLENFKQPHGHVQSSCLSRTLGSC